MTDIAPALPYRGADGSALKWGVSLAAVLLLHIGIGYLIVSWPRARALDTVAPPAVLIDLAPLPAPPVAAPEPVPDPPPTPSPPQPQPPPPPVPDIEPAPLPPPPVTAPHPAVVIPVKSKPVARKPVPKVGAPLVIRETPTVRQTQSPPTQIPSSAPPMPSPSHAVPTWQGALLARLEQFKRYPHAAQARGWEGTAHLRFSLDRQGRVLAVTLARSAGIEVLDQEALALVRRAEPLPAPPAEMPGDPVEITVPVDFHLH